MKVGFDISPLHSGHKGRGIGFYTKNLLEELKKQDDLEICEFTNINDLDKVDIIHYPYFDLFNRSLPIKNKYPTIVTVHDLISLKYPKHYPLGIRAKINFFYQKQALKNVAAIITDSYASMTDIKEYLKIPNYKISVVYLGLSDKFKVIKDQNHLKNIKNKYNLPDKFALFVGNVNWNKNILNMTQACIEAGINLVIVGKSFTSHENLNHPELKSFRIFLEKYSKNPMIHILGYIEDEDLVSIYNLANVTLLVSFDEGFGLPILESQACGIPVITSSCYSMKEISGKSALLVDPNQVEAISNGLDIIFKNHDKYKELIQKGFENAHKYTWNKTALITKEIYRGVIIKNNK